MAGLDAMKNQTSAAKDSKAPAPPAPDSPLGVQTTEGHIGESQLAAELERLFLADDEAAASAESPAPDAQEAKPSDPPADPSADPSDDNDGPVLPTEPETDAEAGDDDDDQEDPAAEDDDERQDPPKWLQKRLARETAKTREAKEAAKAAEAEVADLKAKLKEAAATRVVAAPTADIPLADVTDEQGLDTIVRQAKTVRAWCIENADGGTVTDANGREEDYSAREVARRRVLAEDILSEHVPARKGWIAERRAANDQASRRYPEIFREGSREADYYKQILQRPQGPNDSLAPVRAGREVVGFLVEIGEYKLIPVKKASTDPAAQKPAPAAPAPRPPQAPRPVSAPRPTANAEADARRRRALETGGERELADALESII